MTIEVENKYPVQDLKTLEQALDALGARIKKRKPQVDCYFSHPCRTFPESDEALRLRNDDGDYYITYKGPKLDSSTKSRREIELPLGDDDEVRGGFAELLAALGFKPVAEVRKHRRRVKIDWQDRRVEGGLDEVEDVGMFFELELAVPENEVDAAKACLASLAEQLNLGASERRSYLELLLEKRQGGRLMS